MKSLMTASTLAFLACCVASAAQACGSDNCGEERVIHHRVAVGEVDKWVHVRHKVYADKPERVFLHEDCNPCTGNVGPLEPNATVLGPCAKGWSITPVFGFDYITPKAWINVRIGTKVHVFSSGTFKVIHERVQSQWTGS